MVHSFLSLHNLLALSICQLILSQLFERCDLFNIAVFHHNSNSYTERLQFSERDHEKGQKQRYEEMEKQREGWKGDKMAS